PGKAETFRHDSDWKYKVQLIKVKVLPGKEDDADTEDREGNPKLFCFQKDHSTHITYTSEVILTTHFDNAREADALTFEIMDMDSSRELKDSEIHWVSTKEVEEKIKANKQRLAIGGKIVLKIGHTKYLLKLIKASGKECPHPHETQNLKDVWNANENTEIKVYPNSSLDLEIVDTPQPYTLDSLTVKVSTQDGGGQGGLSLIFGLTEEGDGEKTIVPEKELKKIFLESLPTGGIIHEKQTFTGITGKGEKIKFKLDKLKSKEREGKTFYRGCMYKCLPATEISLEGEKGSAVVISTQPKEINFENIDKKLVEFGIGGMSEQFKDVIARTLLSRSTYSGHIVSLGQKPSRGLLLYGPPGTGKTLLARQLGNILGVTNERIKLLTGSQIWSKWVGDSEKNVRGIFKEARDDQNRHGKDSPLHLLIIDEIDAFLQDRANAERRYETSVVNTFIAELDGLSSNGEDSLNNVIVIGLTNFPDRIDEAVKRPGRLFPHIHIGMPDSAGRKEIFEIHMKNIREGGFLAEDVDMDELIKMTVGRAGAFIEGLVAAAAEYSLKRLWEQRIPVEAIKNHPAAKLYREDFRKAFQECIHQKKKEEKPIIFPATPRQVEEVAQDLRLFGLGGLPSEALQFLSDLKNAQYYKKFLCAMKHPFPRGALLYGPPGIGKRSFAKAIQKLFTLDGQRFQQLKASELWPMQGSHLKAKIEKIIQPARDAAKDLKDDAPLHVVVIDEIDMLYYHKRETDSHDLSVLNQFLMELESLFEGDPKEVNNLLVIGIANRPAFGRLSDGILRHGRLGKHIEMTLPNAKGRREIFEIYLKEYREKEKLDRDVNFDELVEMTRDYSGAYIEGLVSEAGVRMMRRMAAMNVDPSTMLVDEYPKLTMADLKEAHEVMKNDETWKTMMI
ncbi:MAG: AAA family ATPase, partial [Waddliaceae bacterium]